MCELPSCLASIGLYYINESIFVAIPITIMCPFVSISRNWFQKNAPNRYDDSLLLGGPRDGGHQQSGRKTRAGIIPVTSYQRQGVSAAGLLGQMAM